MTRLLAGGGEARGVRRLCESLISPQRSGRPAQTSLSAVAVILVNFWNYAPRDLNERVDPGHRSLYRLGYPFTLPRDPRDSFDASTYPISPYRVVYDLLKYRVDERNRLLVTPYIISSYHGERRGFRHYFGDDAVYIEDCTGSLEEYIREQRVRYIVFAMFNHKRLNYTPVCYGLLKDQYSVKLEEMLLDSFVLEGGHRKALSRNDFVIFEVTGARP